MRKQKLTYIILLGFCLLFSGINAQSEQNRQSINGKEYIVYTVQPGEGLYGISKRHNVSQDAIISANPDMGNSLRSGQQILIPATPATTVSVQQEPDSVIVSYFMHEAKRKETLYGLSRKYNVSIDDLIKLNPGAKEKLKAKTLIRIPQYGPAQPKVETPQTVVTGRHHTIQPKETLFSVARLYGITINQLIESNPGLNTDNFQIGKTLIIPVSGDVQQPNETTNNGSQDETIQFPVGKKSVQATLFLPFNAAVQSKSDINQRRFTEFYEGMLLSVDSLKKMNYNVRLHVYDSYNQDPAALFRQQGVENSDLIIASPSGNQLQAFSDYAFKNKKSLILPFTSKNDEIDSNPFMVQINTPQVYLYDEVIQEFIRRFRNKQVIFLSQAGKTGNKNDFCDLLKQSLDKVGQNYITHQYLNTDIDINSLTLEDGKEYIFVPENSTSESLKIYLPLLQAAKKVNPVLDITLFGYPEWQTYVKDYIEAFYVLNTYIYSPFYADNDSPGLNRFYRNFKNWYHKDILNSYPKFGALGFDTGFFFLQNYAVAGENGIKTIKGKTYNGIQTGFYFKPIKSGGGLINENIYFIHYSPEYLITKIQID